MSESEFNELLEMSWRRPLTAVEEDRLQAHLRAHPDQQIAWDEECTLTDTLNQLPHVPLSSNFTAQVLQALDVPPARSRHFAWPWLGWMPRLGWAVACSVLLLVGFGAFRAHQERQLAEHQLAQGIELIVTAMPSEPEAFAHFDAIQKLGPETSTDETLWLALNE